MSSDGGGLGSGDRRNQSGGLDHSYGVIARVKLIEKITFGGRLLLGKGKGEGPSRKFCNSPKGGGLR